MFDIKSFEYLINTYKIHIKDFISVPKSSPLRGKKLMKIEWNTVVIAWKYVALLLQQILMSALKKKKYETRFCTHVKHHLKVASVISWKTWYPMSDADFSFGWHLFFWIFDVFVGHSKWEENYNRFIAWNSSSSGHWPTIVSLL